MAQPQRALEPRTQNKSRKLPAEATANAVPQPRSDPAIAHEEIAVLAHSYWEARGDRDGGPEDGWFRAERDVRSLRRTRLL